MHVSRQYLPMAFLCAAMVGTASGETPAGGTLFPGDARLDQEVSISRGRTHLGEVLEDLSQRARVTISADPSRGAVDGMELTVIVKERPVRTVMSGLQDLLSHRDNRWVWRPAPAGRPAYVLQPELSFAEASAAARRGILAGWEKGFREHYRSAALAHARGAPPPGQGTDPPEIARIQAAKLSLFGSIGPAQVDDLLRGSPVPIDFDRLPGEMQGALDFGIPRPPDGGKPSQSHAGFYVTWNRQYLGPVLWLRNDRGMAQNVFGGLRWDAHWYRTEGEGWRDLGDPAVQSFLKRKVADPAATGETLPARRVAEWVARAAERQGLSVILDPVFPRAHATTGNAFLGRSSEDTMLAIVLGTDLTWRQYEGLNLLRDKTAMLNPRAHLVPWQLIKDLRTAARGNGGYLDLPQLASTADLSVAQRIGLAEEFPDLSAARVEPWKPILRFYSQLEPGLRTKLTSVAGLGFRDAAASAQKLLTPAAPPARPPVPDAGEPSPPVDRLGLALLNRHAGEATLSLRVEKPKPPMAVGRHLLIWEVRVSGQVGHATTLPLTPRAELEPK